MDKNMEIVAGLKCCALRGNENCPDCPYKNRREEHRSCRQILCIEAAGALAEAVQKNQAQAEEINDLANQRGALYNEVNELRDELRDEIRKRDQKQTPVYSEVEGLQNDVQKLVEAVNFWRDKANYWQGIADGIKWGVHDRFKNTDNASDDAVEVPDDV